MHESFEPEEYLAHKGYRGRSAGGSELTYNCFFDCAEPEGGKSRKLYVNRETSQFICFKCDAAGGMFALMNHFGDKPGKGAEVEPSRQEILTAAMNVAHRMLLNNEDQLLYLMGEARGLTPESIQEHKFGFVPARWSLNGCLTGYTKDQLADAGLITSNGSEFFGSQHDSLVVPYQRGDAPVQLRAKDLGGHYRTPVGGQVRVFNADRVTASTREVVIVEGEFDAAVLQQLLDSSSSARWRKVAVLGIPGVSTAPAELEALTAKSQRVFIAFDPDDAGERGAIRLAEKIGNKARIVEWDETVLAQMEADGFVRKEIDWSSWIAKYQPAPEAVINMFRNSAGRRLVSIPEAFAKWRDRHKSGGYKLGYGELDGWITPGLLPGQVMIPLATTGSGKGHPLHTSVLTPDGEREWGELKVGDYVFGSDGEPTKVTAIHDRGVLPTYRVRFSDRTSVEVDGDHIWTVNQKYGKLTHWIKRSNITTKELAQNPLSKIVSGRQAFLYRIPMARPLQLRAKEFPIDPYSLGALIANGSLKGTAATLTTPDLTVAERVARHHQVTVRAKQPGECLAFGVKKIVPALRGMGLQVLSRDKFIPEDYFWGSEQQRWDLLHGLMDCDGSARPGRRNVLYYTTSDQLAKDVCRLVQSLGGTGFIRSTIRHNRSTGAPYTESTVSIKLAKSAFWSGRKSESVIITRNAVAHRAIVKVERVDDQEIRCISVEADDQLYLIGKECIVTHNSVFLCNVTYNMASNNLDKTKPARDKKRILLVSLEMTAPEVYERLARIMRFYWPHATDEDIAERYENVMICDENRLSDKDLVDLMTEFEDEIGEPCQVVMVDYLGYYARGFPGPEYERTSDAVMNLKAIAKKFDVAVISPHQVNRGAEVGKPLDLQDARGSGVIEETADFLLSLFRPGDAIQDEQVVQAAPSTTVRLGLLKSRHGNAGRTMSMHAGPFSLVMVDAGFLESRLERETDAHARGKSYDEYRQTQMPQAHQIELPNLP